MAIPTVELKRLATKAKGQGPFSFHPRRGVVHDGRWFVVGTYTLQTIVWDGEDWRELARGEYDGAEANEVAALVSMGKDLVAVRANGALLAWSGKAWKSSAAPSKAFGTRSGCHVAWDAARERLVAWGGGTGRKPKNETLLFEGGAWRKAAKKSAEPKDYVDLKDSGIVDWHLVYDEKRRAVLRLGTREVAALDGETWVASAPTGYHKAVAPHWSRPNRLPVHDAKSGRTFVANLERGIIHELAGKACVEVATIVAPFDPAYFSIDSAPPSAPLHGPAKPDLAIEPAAARPWQALVDDACYNPARRVIELQSAGAAADRFEISLASLG